MSNILHATCNKTCVQRFYVHKIKRRKKAERGALERLIQFIATTEITKNRKKSQNWQFSNAAKLQQNKNEIDNLHGIYNTFVDLDQQKNWNSYSIKKIFKFIRIMC